MSARDGFVRGAVYATIGSEPGIVQGKSIVYKDQKAEHLMSPPSLDFTEKVKALTQPEGSPALPVLSNMSVRAPLSQTAHRNAFEPVEGVFSTQPSFVALLRLSLAKPSELLSTGSAGEPLFDSYAT